MNPDPPPYEPPTPKVPSAPGVPAGFFYAATPYQTFPQGDPGTEQYFYYPGPPGLRPPMPSNQIPMSPPGYQDSDPGPAEEARPSKHTVYLMDNQEQENGSASCLAVVSTLLCCCSLLPLVLHHCWFF
ncbi:cysteine-rich and transmembrane domain-containing protein 1-like [Gouania willdenowi]|uniref:cysteine-rich and transmembrane domain-containing protein 1-like n=1 Tax=Gouania willdenowi TaxID=441366 RepID=UPI001056B302|nr:cysteine-rich and transmembrane domain-containing protein 1-like [Gouania willdenowi]